MGIRTARNSQRERERAQLPLRVSETTSAEARAKFVLVVDETGEDSGVRRKERERKGKKKSNQREESAGIHRTKGRNMKEGKREKEVRATMRTGKRERGGHNRTDRVIIRDEKHLTSAPGW